VEIRYNEEKPTKDCPADWNEFPTIFEIWSDLCLKSFSIDNFIDFETFSVSLNFELDP
jgi:hypothetical protein